MAKNNSTTSGIEKFDSELQTAVLNTQGLVGFDGYVRGCFKVNISYEMLTLKIETAIWTDGKTERAFSDDEKAAGKQALSNVRSRINPADCKKIVTAAKAAAEKAKKGSGKNVTVKSLGLKSPQARTQTGSRIFMLRMFALCQLVYNRIQQGLDVKNEQHKAAAAICPVLTEKMTWGEMLAAACAHKVVQTFERKRNGKVTKHVLVHPSLDDQYSETVKDRTLKGTENAKLFSLLRQSDRQLASWPTARKLKSLTDSEHNQKLADDKKVADEIERASGHIADALPKSGKLSKLDKLATLAEKKFNIEIPRKKKIADGIEAILSIPDCRIEFARGKQRSECLASWYKAGSNN